MKRLPFLAATPALLVSGAASADAGLHAHPHLADAARPLFDLHPALGLAVTILVWAIVVAGVEALTRGRAAA